MIRHEQQGFDCIWRHLATVAYMTASSDCGLPDGIVPATDKQHLAFVRSSEFIVVARWRVNSAEQWSVIH